MHAITCNQIICFLLIIIIMLCTNTCKTSPIPSVKLKRVIHIQGYHYHICYLSLPLLP